MTEPLKFHRCNAPVQTILPPLTTDNDRIRAFLVREGGYSPFQIWQFLRGYDLVSIARRQLGIKD